MIPTDWWRISRERMLSLTQRSPAARDAMFAWMRERYEDWPEGPPAS